jgi:NAD(P)H-flavin reductase/quinol-cytochrome oxidoreductase complex cytochrome b subunit
MIKHLQRGMRWLFMRVEALFNAAFGDRRNPLYHLGAISFFLFWIVAVSGLYLYVFFKTGVADAYASVLALTEGQWYAGGIMRSVHRYASDAMVLTMLVHLLRHFAFDRFRGFRWFSWITGVMLIWLVYVSGINGYMLPWDKLAQFVVVASFEWLDWLPIFDGALIRNFIYQASVNDRFFSLLSFIHIGLPLLVLLLMWIHVQRVPKASTNPPRTIMLCLLLTLLALALIEPALSQGGAADFGAVPSTLALDWFYLPAFPLLYLWPLGQVWLLLLAATALLAALPWLPPKFRRGAKREFQMRLHPDKRNVAIRAGETLLEAGLRAGIALPFECRNGACGKCKCTLLHGSVDHGAYQASALNEAEKALGTALMCCAVPRSDLEIEYEAGASAAAVQTYSGRVHSMERLSDEVMRLMVSPPAGANLRFVAGQYINILLADGQRRAFSFANPPHQSEYIELHVRLIAGGRFTTRVFTQMQVGDELRFEGPLGSFCLRESERPILFVAGATGFAPVKSIVEDAFHRGMRRTMLLYWGVRRPEDLYMRELAQRWQQEHDNFKFVPVLSEPRPEDRWQGRSGFVHQAILADFPDLNGYEVYVCGSAKMVDTAFPAFLEQGLSEEHCFSDAFLPSSG